MGPAQWEPSVAAGGAVPLHAPGGAHWHFAAMLGCAPLSLSLSAGLEAGYYRMSKRNAALLSLPSMQYISHAACIALHCIATRTNLTALDEERAQRAIRTVQHNAAERVAVPPHYLDTASQSININLHGESAASTHMRDQ